MTIDLSHIDSLNPICSKWCTSSEQDIFSRVLDSIWLWWEVMCCLRHHVYYVCLSHISWFVGHISIYELRFHFAKEQRGKKKKKLTVILLDFKKKIRANNKFLMIFLPIKHGDLHSSNNLTWLHCYFAVWCLISCTIGFCKLELVQLRQYNSPLHCTVQYRKVIWVKGHLLPRDSGKFAIFLLWF